MKYTLLIFTCLLLSSNFCNAQSKRTPTVIKDGGGFNSEEEWKSHQAKLKMESEKQKLRSQAAKTASKEKLARYNEQLEKEIKEAIERDAKNTTTTTTTTRAASKSAAPSKKSGRAPAHSNS